MPRRPLLVFPTRTVSDRWKLPGGAGGRFHVPDINRQREHIEPQFARLQQAFEAGRARLQNNPLGIEPEQVLVLETRGTIHEFARAVKHVPGLEWLAEWEEFELGPDDDFYYEEDREKTLHGSLLLVMSDQEAMRQLVRLWEEYKQDPGRGFRRGFAKFRELFIHLKTIRPWDTTDRLKDTGVLEDWRYRVAQGIGRVRFEIEMWFRDDPARREQRHTLVRLLLEQEAGRVIAQATIPAIRYHGLLGDLPIAAVEKVLREQSIRVLQCDDVMFFRPLGQCSFPLVDEVAGLE